jgi:putative intracellular protease/amidase/quinol monooxygenase YgiN
MPQFKNGVLIVVSILMTIANGNQAGAQETTKMKSKVLFVVTSHDKKGETGEPTGFHFSEVTHPWDVLVNAGYEIDFVSPKGGKAPVTALDLTDPINKKFWDNQTYKKRIEKSKRPSEIDPSDYVAIHFAGGHGAMWDFPDDVTLADIAARIYQNNGVVSAVCHGPAGLINIKLSNGKYLVDGKRINAFTNEEEEAVKLTQVVPFLLESKLIERGAIFEESAPWQVHVVTDQRVITGQNPQSAKAVGEAVLEQLRSIEVIGRLTRYAVKPAHQDDFRRALSNYVSQALAEEGNIQAEAYHEQDNQSVLWLIERWKNRSELERFGQNLQSRAVSSLESAALSSAAKTYLVTDLEPLSKQQWRRTAQVEDHPLTVMLFVDSKEGTQDDFKSMYHFAMPPFRSQPGVVTYQLSQVLGDDTKFVTFEKFRSPEAFQHHLNFPPIKPVIDYLQTNIKQQPFQSGLHTLVEFAPLTRE